MAFVVTSTPSFAAPILIGAYDENGKYVEHQVQFKFKRFDRVKTKEFVDEMVRKTEEFMKGEPSPEQVLENDLNDLEKFVIGWVDVDVNGSTEFNRDNLRTLLLTYPSAARSIFWGYTQAAGGAKLGN